MNLRLIQKGVLLVGAALLGAAVDRLLFPANAASESALESIPFPILTSSGRAPMSAEFASELDRFVNTANTAAIWAALTKSFPGKDEEVVRAALDVALKTPLTNKNEPWKDPARPQTEALVELLLLWEVPEMATDLLVETPGRIGVGLLMRAFRAHYQKDATTAEALAATMPKDHWRDLSWLKREEKRRSPIPPPTPPGGTAQEPWEWNLPDPLAETEACLAALDALPAHERQRIIGGMYRSPGGVGSPVSNFWEGYPEIAARFVERLPPGANERGNEVRTVVNALAQKDPKKALAWLDALEDYASTELAYGQVMEAYAERDPKAAAAWVEERVSDSRSHNAAHALTRHWASEDPQAALAWGRGLDDPALRQMAIQAGLGQWANDDASAALAVALEEAGPQRQEALRTVFHSYGQADLDAAWKDAQALGGEDFTIALRGMLTYRFSSGLDDLSPYETMIDAYVAGEPEVSEHRSFDPVVGAYARALVKQDAPRALEWALSVPSGTMRASSLNGMFSDLAYEDPYAASEILSTLTPGPDRDVAITASFDGLNERDPERAFQWALSADSNETQLELGQRAIRHWRGDFVDLQQAVDVNPDLSPPVREELLQALAARQSR